MTWWAISAWPYLAAMGIQGGGGGEWVLTDSAFHIGYRACGALVRLAAAHPAELAGVEVDAYGDFMQPLGNAADTAYLGRIDHVASVAGSASTNTSAAAATATAAAAAAVAETDQTPAGRLRHARELVATALRGCPLLILPLLPSRFLHVGTMPELLKHTAVDEDVLRALPQAPAGISLGTWDVAAMESVGRMPSVGFDGVWGSGRGAGPGACILTSVVGRSARIGAGRAWQILPATLSTHICSPCRI